MSKPHRTSPDEAVPNRGPIPLVVRAAREIAAERVAAPDEVGAPAQVMPFRPPEAAASRRVQLDRERLVAQGYVDPGGGSSRLAEEMRIIKRPMMSRAFMAEAAPRDRIILVTSAMPGEGKTFTAINLALSLSLERDASVLLIDGDQATASAAERLGIPRDPGLSDLLLDEPVDPGRVLNRTSVERLTFIPPGAATGELPELVGSRRMTAILDAILAADQRRLIVIDAPPILASSDAVALAALAGQIAFIIAAGMTPREAVDDAIRLIPPDRQVQLVLNRVTGGRRHVGYGTYGRIQKASVRRFWPWRNHSTAVVAVAGAISVAAAPSAFARWSVVPRIEVGTAVTDNADLDAGDDRRGDIIAEVTPGINVDGRSERVRAKADYALQALTHVGRSDHVDLRQRLDAAARTELAPDLAYVDVGGNIGQVFVDDREPLPRLDLVDTQNRATRYAGTLSPFLQRQVAALGEVAVRYRLTGVGYDDHALADGISQTGTAGVESAPSPSPLTWRASMAADQVSLDATEDEEAFDSRSLIAAVDASYAVRRGWAVLAGLGYSWLEDESLEDGTRLGPYWSLGVAARPHSGLRVEARAGQVFQEPTAHIAAEARLSPIWRVQASYAQGLQSRFGLVRSALERAVERTSPERVKPLDEEPPPSFLLEDRSAISSNASFRQRRGEVTLAYEKERNAADLTALVERRAFDDSRASAVGDEEAYGIGLGLGRRLTRRASLGLRGYWTRISYTEGEGKDHELGVTASWRYRLSRQARLDLGYDLYHRIADDAEDIVANTIFARFVQEF